MLSLMLSTLQEMFQYHSEGKSNRSWNAWRSKVDKPTLWCAGVVVVPKKSNDVRICVDLEPLNESVLRETHPLPGVDEILAQLTGATVMSERDVNSGFWQIPLTKKSHELTTFIMPFVIINYRFIFQVLLNIFRKE